MEIHELKAARFKFLHHLYKLTGGNEMKWYKEAEIGQELGFDKSLTDLVGQYLKNEGLIEYRASGPMIGITHYGVIEVEDALMNPDQPTQYFPPVVNIINVHHMEGSQIQQGTVSSSQTGAFTAETAKNLTEFINLLKDKLPELQFQENDKSELQADLSTIEAQLLSTRPKISIIKESLTSIKHILEGVAGGIIAGQLLKYLPALLAAL